MATSVQSEISSKMETTSRRPWETTSPNQPHSMQTLPSISTLTSNFPPPSSERQRADLSINPPQRDSGTWMTNSALTASSTQSGNTMPFLNSAHSPSGAGPSSFSPEVTSNPGSYRNSQNEPLGQPTAHHPNRGSGDYDDSRRSSVSNSIHQGMNNLGLGPTSPYHSNNHSQSSITAGLQQQRGIANGYIPARHSTMNGPISPYSHRGGRGGFTAGRVAPPILENPKSEVYAAADPVPGQAYAFPDPDAPPRAVRPPSEYSRRNSFAESFTSSILTMESSRLPHGQHELPAQHHHMLVNKQIDNLRDDPDSPNSTTPYSRTPELRVTHKLAERKRRSEMKDCFELLRTRLPSGQTNKSSKWETLSRAIDYITSLENQVKSQRMDSDKQRHQLQDMEHKMQQMSEQLQRLQHQGSYPPPPNAMPTSPHNYNGYHANGVDASGDPPRTLPPIMNGAMQGVQYSEDRR